MSGLAGRSGAGIGLLLAALGLVSSSAVGSCRHLAQRPRSEPEPKEGSGGGSLWMGLNGIQYAQAGNTDLL